VPLLIANLAGDATLAGKVAEHLVHLIATTSPGAKKGSTAPYAWAEFVLAEAGSRPPRSLAGAFRKPCEPSIAAAVARFSGHLTGFDTMYGAGERRYVAALDAAEVPGADPQMPLPELAASVRREIAGAVA
jgi:CRISPR system Cascade subunit CasC